MIDLTAIFDMILEQQRSLDVAESEFRRMMVDDPELRKAYKQWCAEQQESERNGFSNYCRERIEQAESCWEALTEEDDDNNY